MSESVKEFYSNDIVFRFNKRRRIVFGVVVATYENSDADDSQLLSKGQMLVYWLRKLIAGCEHVVNQSKVKLLSRNVLDGDIVRRLENGKETQRGYCRSITRTSVVHLMGCNSVIDDVSHDRLRYVHQFELGAPVTIGDRIGRMHNCEYLVKLTSRDGSVVEVVPVNLKGPRNTFRVFDDTELYLGDYSLGSIKNIVPANLKHAKWLKKTRTIKQNLYKHHLFVVQKITPIEVTINVHSLRGQANYLYDVPKEEIPQIKVLKTLDEAVPEFYEQRCLTITPTDVVHVKKDWFAKQSSKYRPGVLPPKKAKKSIRSPKSRRHSHIVYRALRERLWRNIRGGHRIKRKDEKDPDWTTDDEDEDTCVNQKHTNTIRPGHPAVVQALCTDAKATIIWQDGTMEENVSTTQLYYSISLDDHEFFPGEWVTRADVSLDVYGVVQKVDYLERTAQVKWFMYETDTPIFTHLEEVSVYDIKRHPTFVFRPGSVVFHKKASVNNLGTVIDSFPDGYVMVKWLDDTVEECWPPHIGILPDMEDEEQQPLEAELDTSVHMSWETESYESTLGDMPTEPTWHTLAARLEFIRDRIGFLREALLLGNSNRDENFSFLKNLLSVYENSIYLDKLLGTQFFSIHSSHYQALLGKIKETAKESGIEIRSKVSIHSMDELKAAEMDSINKVMKLECHLQIDILKDPPESGSEPTTPSPLENDAKQSNTGLCIELLSMIKCRLDLSFAEIISRVGGVQAFSILTKSSQGVTGVVTPATSTPMRSVHNTSDDSFTSITYSPPKPGDCNLDAMAVSPEKKSPEPSALKAIVLAPAKTVMMNGDDYVGKPFEVLEEAPACHRYYRTVIEPVETQRFYRAIMNESVILKESLPPGVWVYAFSNRTDLYSVMIRGPDNTPYEDGLFIFDLQLSAEYPRSPPQCSYISYNSERLNPNLYVKGRVCVSLLGTWMGRGTEVWGPKSTLLQLIVSIQGLILVSEPYYNEAGFEKQCNSQQGYENSRTYNELVLLRLVQSMTVMLESPHEVFRREIYKHFSENGEKMLLRLGGWIDGVYDKEPEFPLLPVSKGLKLSLRACLDRFKQVLQKHTAS